MSSLSPLSRFAALLFGESGWISSMLVNMVLDDYIVLITKKAMVLICYPGIWNAAAAAVVVIQDAGSRLG